MSYKTLLITGENNHDWKRSAPFCLDLLQASGKFEVEQTEDPSTALSDPSVLKDVQLLFLDYNGPEWSAAAKTRFVDAVRTGTGVCVFHAANNAFKGWQEFEEICALMWREGTGHGAYHDFDVHSTGVVHPITEGLPELLMKAHPDELYQNLVHMHDAPYQVLATAYSSPESGGSEKDEPVLIVRSYAEGRIFHCILGHVWEGGPMSTFENPDFQKILLRGCEWAACGSVSL